MAWLSDLSVRSLPVGGSVADAVTGRPPGWLQGRRSVVIFVHGYDNSEDDARTSYFRVFTRSLENVVHVYWPGDTRGGSLFSALSYPWQIESARDSAKLIAEFLRTMTGPEGTPQTVNFIGHSLGCRLVLEMVREVLAKSMQWPDVRLIVLMAAAVPVDLLNAGALLDAAVRHPNPLVIYYSTDDGTLKGAFPIGQAAAYRLGIEQGSYPNALGRYGCDGAIIHDRRQVRLGHSEYWPNAAIADQVAGLLGKAVPREVLTRSTPTSPGPPSAPPRPTRQPLSREV